MIQRDGLIACGPRILAGVAILAAGGLAGATAGPPAVAPGVPALFVENVGQLEPGIRFEVWGGGGLALAEDGVWVPGKSASIGNPTAPPNAPATPRRATRYKLGFAGTRRRPRPEPFGRLATRVSYFRGPDPARWHRDVPAWRGVRYRDLYPGFDLEVTARAGGWGWRWVPGPEAQPFGLPQPFGWASPFGLPQPFGWASPFGLPQPSGLASPFGPRPARGVRPPFGRPGRGAPPDAPPEDRPAATHDRPADLVYGTFLGGGSSWLEEEREGAAALAIDATGAAYVAGMAYSNFGESSPAPGGMTRQVFVAKLNPAGSGLDYLALLAGDEATDLAVDASGAAYVVGSAGAGGIPTTPGALSPVGRGSLDAFVVKLGPAGDDVAYGTYLGGISYDRASSIAVRSDGAAAVAGETNSDDFPVAAGAYDATYNGGRTDAFLALLNPAGGALEYGTFVGGGGVDAASAVDLDDRGVLAAAGSTDSGDFPAAAEPFGPPRRGGTDAFVVRVDPARAADAYTGAILGGSGDDAARAVAWAAGGMVAAAGETGSDDFPTSPGALDPTCGTATRCENHIYRHDAFVARLDLTGRSPSNATFLGGYGDDRASALAVDIHGAAYVAGMTDSEDFPTTADAFDRTRGSSGDAFVAKLDPSGTALSYGTYLGGTGWDEANAIAIDDHAAGYVAGMTSSADFPVVPEAFQPSLSGRQDAFAVRLALGGPILPTPTLVTPVPTRSPTTTPTPGPSATSTSSPTPTLTSVPGRVALGFPEDGALLPQPLAPATWDFRFSGRQGPCTGVISISGPGGRSLSMRRVAPPYRYSFTTDIPLPDDALGPWRWQAGVSCPLGGNGSETRTFWVERAPTPGRPPAPTPAVLKLLASDRTAYADFAHSVAAEEDTVIVGAAQGDDGRGRNAGAAHILARDGEAWVRRGRLTAGDGKAGDLFGSAVALDGEHAIAGAFQSEAKGLYSGAAYIFERRGDAWIEQAKLVASDEDPYDYFGYSVAISGETAIVGSLWDDDRGEDAGAAYVFVLRGGTWVEQAKLLAGHGGAGDRFGASVAISGDRVIVGAVEKGRAYMFARDGERWVEEASLAPAIERPSGDFGASVAIDGDLAVVGAERRFDNALPGMVEGEESGAAYVFARAGNRWAQQALLVPSVGQPNDDFGASVAIRGSRVLVGAPGSQAALRDGGGMAYLFARTGTAWVRSEPIFARDGLSGDGFGAGVALGADTLIVGAPGVDDDPVSDIGSVYVFHAPEGSARTIFVPYAERPGAPYALAAINATGDITPRSVAANGRTMDGGGAAMSGGGFALAGTVGQPAVDQPPESATPTATGTATPTATASATVTASATATTSATATATPTARATATASPTSFRVADLQVGVDDSADPVGPERRFTYRITARNAGPSGLQRNVSIVATFQEAGGVRFTGIYTHTGSPLCNCTFQGGFRCFCEAFVGIETYDLEAIAPRVPAPTTAVLCADIRSSWMEGNDPDPSNNHDCEATTVLAAPPPRIFVPLCAQAWIPQTPLVERQSADEDRLRPIPALPQAAHRILESP